MPQHDRATKRRPRRADLLAPMVDFEIVSEFLSAAHERADRADELKRKRDASIVTLIDNAVAAIDRNPEEAKLLLTSVASVLREGV